MISDHIRHVLFYRVLICHGEVYFVRYLMFFFETSPNRTQDPRLSGLVLLRSICWVNTFWNLSICLLFGPLQEHLRRDHHDLVSWLWRYPYKDHQNRPWVNDESTWDGPDPPIQSLSSGLQNALSIPKGPARMLLICQEILGRRSRSLH